MRTRKSVARLRAGVEAGLLSVGVAELVGGLDESSLLPESFASAVPMASPATPATTTTATSLPSSLYGVLRWARRGAPSGRRLRNGGLTSASAQQRIDRGLEHVQHRPRRTSSDQGGHNSSRRHTRRPVYAATSSHRRAHALLPQPSEQARPRAAGAGDVWRRGAARPSRRAADRPEQHVSRSTRWGSVRSDVAQPRA